jgi:pSer/pThr/pTyr-binding forkhead associated (FHA) protein
MGDSTDKPAIASPSQQNSRLRAIRLKIGPGEREIEMPLIKSIYLGRLDPASAVLPEIDLTDYGALTTSVSRRHARIFKQKNKVVIEDLGSVNGTFVNGRRLVPYLPETLNDGDTMQLSKLLIEVKIMRMRQEASTKLQ